MGNIKLIQAFEESLGRSFHRLVSPGRGVLLAISGGPDSMALLAATARLGHRLGLALEAATVDHSLRPESMAENTLVSSLATSLGVPHRRLAAPVEAGAGIEERARNARYAALEILRKEKKLDVVVTAHTANDQAETLLMRLARGTSLAGAAAIHEARADRIVRPMLFATRAEIEAYVAALSLQVARDSMNDDRRFLRVRMRQDVVPALEAVAGPGAVRALARFSGLAADDEGWLRDEATRALARIHWEEDNSLEAEGLGALGFPIARRVLAIWLAEQEVELDSALLGDVWRAAQRGGTATLPGERVLSSSNGRVFVRGAPPRTSRNFILNAGT